MQREKIYILQHSTKFRIAILLCFSFRNFFSVQKKEKVEKETKYVLEKIKSLQEAEKKKNNEIITTLPKFESNFVQLHKNYYKV